MEWKLRAKVEMVPLTITTPITTYYTGTYLGICASWPDNPEH